MVNMRTGLVKNWSRPVVIAIATKGNRFPQVSVRSTHNVIFERPVAVQLLPKQVRKPDATGLLNSKKEITEENRFGQGTHALPWFWWVGGAELVSGSDWVDECKCLNWWKYESINLTYFWKFSESVGWRQRHGMIDGMKNFKWCRLRCSGPPYGSGITRINGKEDLYKLYSQDIKHMLQSSSISGGHLKKRPRRVLRGKWQWWISLTNLIYKFLVDLKGRKVFVFSSLYHIYICYSGHSRVYRYTICRPGPYLHCLWCGSLKHRYLCIRILALPNLISFLFLFAKTLHFIVGTDPQERFLKYVKLTEKKFSAWGKIGASLETAMEQCQKCLQALLAPSCGIWSIVSWIASLEAVHFLCRGLTDKRPSNGTPDVPINGCPWWELKQVQLVN